MISKKRLLRKSGIYLITDRDVLKGKDLASTLLRSLEAGVDMMQFRDKEASDREFFETGEKIKRILKGKKVLFIVNERVDMAAALNSDGVHLGQDDMPVEEARRLLGKEKIIGLSAHSIDEIRESTKKDVDYVSIGPIFLSQTKPEYKAVGLGLLKTAAEEIKISLVAIGGINKSNIKDVIAAGAKKIAVSRAILSSEDPYTAAKNLIKELEI